MRIAVMLVLTAFALATLSGCSARRAERVTVEPGYSYVKIMPAQPAIDIWPVTSPQATQVATADILGQTDDSSMAEPLIGLQP